MSNISVLKRDGKKEDFNVEKINRVVGWATEGLTGVSVTDIEINAKLNIRDKISTQEIHKVLIETAANLISIDHPNYQYVAGRLLNYQLRKDVWGGKNPPKLIDIIKKNIKLGYYTKELLDMYTEQEFNKIDEFINHDRDFIFTYAGVKQLTSKYLVQNRRTREIYETPQFSYVIIAAILFADYPKEQRLQYIRTAYNYFSKHKINLPTPIMGGVRTTMKSFASCLLTDIDDTLNSIFANVTIVGQATARRYGIGINAGKIRAIGAPIRNGEVIHTGLIPFLKTFEATVKSCHQNGIRGGGGTVNVPIFHYEIEDVLVLKNNSGTEENRVRKLDYCIGVSRLFYERLMKHEPITLFSPHECPDLFKAFGLPEFDELYVKYENDRKLKFKKTVCVSELFELFTKERIETGRIYTLNVDHANSHSPWLDPVSMTNLCVEILHPTIPAQSYEDPNAEIGVCILAAINWLEISSDAEFERVCDIVVRMLDSLIDYQEYFCPAARNFAVKRRSLGIGITNLAGFFAKHNVKYEQPEAANLAAEWMEKQQYFLLKASSKLAEERGPCESYNRTKYSQGILPIDTYKKDRVDSVITVPLKCDWEQLRAQIARTGLRNSTLTAIMPCESSSVAQSATNGIEPPRALMIAKGSKSNFVPVLVPNIISWKNRYTLAFDMKDNTGYLNIVAGLQKFVDMAISTNLYYNYAHYPNGLLPHSKVLRETLYHFSMGGKSIYYTNTDDGDKEQLLDSQTDDSCASGACSV